MVERGETAVALPPAGTVLRAQLWTVARARRWTLILLAGGLALLFAAAVWALAQGAEVNPLALLGTGDDIGAYPLVLILSVFWGLGVWHDEPPSRRLYHWSMPVRRDAHDRYRLLAGALWMFAGIAALVAGTVLIAALTGYAGSIPSVPATLWPTYFLGPLVLYLFTTVASLRSEHPAAWVFGVFVGLQLAPVLIDGIFGLGGRFVAMVGEFVTGPAGPGTALVGGLRGSPGWAPAMLLWMGLALAAAWGATLREPDA